MDFYPILKAGSMIATGVFGILGVLTNYKDKEGRVTKWGKVAIAGICLSGTLSLVLYGIEASKATQGAKDAKKQYEETKNKLDTALEESNRLTGLQRISLDKAQALEERMKSTTQSLEAINTVSHEMSEKQAALLNAQRLAEARLRLGQLRTTFPLEPLRIYFEREISMGDQNVASFVEKLKHEISVIPGSIIDLNMERLRTDNFPKMPSITQFVFTRQAGAQRSTVVFSCMSEAFPRKSAKGTGAELVILPRNAEALMKMGLVVDFLRNVLVQKIMCINPARSGNDIASISALDLVGRRMTYGAFSELMKFDFGSGVVFQPEGFSVPDTDIRRIALVFPYDYQSEGEARYLVIDKGVTSVEITAKSIGLGGLDGNLMTF